jgi:undecaprenyl phosphate N,N'-diacetylbacillosamine 1-phosphate transferase
MDVARTEPQHRATARIGGSYVKVVKPLFDFIFSGVALLLLSPLFLLIGLLIKIDSPGPVLFVQPRIGKEGKEFAICKFRTMHVTAPSQGASPEDEGDARITKIGRFLRRTSLDEVPQLLNVLKGEMSLVGPRPEQKLLVEQFHAHFADHPRFLVKPGITGLWQISPDRMKPIHENLQHDAAYIRKVSWLLDLRILVQTITVILKSNTV